MINDDHCKNGRTVCVGVGGGEGAHRGAVPSKESGKKSGIPIPCKFYYFFKLGFVLNHTEKQFPGSPRSSVKSVFVS